MRPQVTPRTCTRCGEIVGLVAFGAKFASRPYRISRCKDYRGALTWTCRGEGDTPTEALVAFPSLSPAVGLEAQR